MKENVGNWKADLPKPLYLGHRSVGVLAYVLLTGHSPFGGNTKQETFLNISQGHVDFPEELFEGVSETAMDFITRLLIVEPGWERES